MRRWGFRSRQRSSWDLSRNRDSYAHRSVEVRSRSRRHTYCLGVTTWLTVAEVAFWTRNAAEGELKAGFQSRWSQCSSIATLEGGGDARATDACRLLLCVVIGLYLCHGREKDRLPRRSDCESAELSAAGWKFNNEAQVLGDDV